MAAQYTLYVDEAGDDKAHSLKPENPTGNSEWLCLGGYLVKSERNELLEGWKDGLLRSFGGQTGNPLHFRNYKPWNRVKIAKGLAELPARGFVVCSYKHTMIGHNNSKAEAAGNESSNRQYLYNFVVRLLLERVTTFVGDHAALHNISNPKIQIVMASRRGHHFGHLKAYIHQIIQQAKAGRTFLDTREILPDLLSWNLIDRIAASQSPGCQLADALVSSVFQSIETLSPNRSDEPARHLKKMIATKQRSWSKTRQRANEGMTLYPASKALPKLTADQVKFFNFFGYTLTPTPNCS